MNNNNNYAYSNKYRGDKLNNLDPNNIWLFSIYINEIDLGIINSLYYSSDRSYNTRVSTLCVLLKLISMETILSYKKIKITLHEAWPKNDIQSQLENLLQTWRNYNVYIAFYFICCPSKKSWLIRYGLLNIHYCLE